MNQDSERVVVSRDPWERQVAIRYGVLREGEWWVAQPIELKPLQPGLTAEPTLTLSGDAAQRLMDELWNIGIRPTEGTGSAGSLAATERHLADMRRIALEALEKHGAIREPVAVMVGPVGVTGR